MIRLPFDTNTDIVVWHIQNRTARRLHLNCDLLAKVRGQALLGIVCRVGGSKFIEGQKLTSQIDKRFCNVDVSVGIDSEALREKSEVA